MCEAMRLKRWVWLGGGNHEFTTVHVANLVNGIWCTTQKGRNNNVYYFTDGKNVNQREFLGRLVGLRGVDASQCWSIPSWLGFSLAYCHLIPPQFVHMFGQNFTGFDLFLFLFLFFLFCYSLFLFIFMIIIIINVLLPDYSQTSHRCESKGRTRLQKCDYDRRRVGRVERRGEERSRKRKRKGKRIKKRKNLRTGLVVWKDSFCWKKKIKLLFLKKERRPLHLLARLPLSPLLISSL